VSDARPAGRRATYRGVRWRRDESGTTAWFNEGIKRWVRWYPGADAPPLPPRWAKDAAPAPARPTRPRWRSPYRVVPIVLIVFVVAAGIYQATRSVQNPVASEARAAQALVGKCLTRIGTAAGKPTYQARPVPCELPLADVKVVSVLPGVPGSPSCPASTTAVHLKTLGVRYPHVECVTPVHAGG
jgi:hypothetical protein